MDDECFFNQNEENKDRFIFLHKIFQARKSKKKSIPFPHFNSNSNPVQTMFHFRFLFFDLFNQKIEKLQHQFISSGCCCWNTMSSSSLHLTMIDIAYISHIIILTHFYNNNNVDVQNGIWIKYSQDIYFLFAKISKKSHCFTINQKGFFVVVHTNHSTESLSSSLFIDGFK